MIEQDDGKKNCDCPEDELYDLCNNIDPKPDPEIVHQFSKLENEVRHREREKPNLWHICYKAKWMKLGDAPTQYFYKLF